MPLTQQIVHYSQHKIILPINGKNNGILSLLPHF